MDLLAIHWSVDPVLIHLGSFGIRWYSLLFVAGFIIGWYLFRWFFRREGVNEKLLDPLLYTLRTSTCDDKNRIAFLDRQLHRIAIFYIKCT